MSDSKPTRRNTLLNLGAAGALLAACKKRWRPAADDEFSRSREKPYVPGAEGYSTHEERWAATTCDQCPAGCGIRVRVVEGRAVRIEGNPANPLNQGGIGPRGLAGLQVLYDPDRITGPMLRRNGELVAATWDEAVDAAVGALRGKSGREVLVMSGRERGMIHDLWRRFCQGLGGGTFLDGRATHSGPLAAAMKATVGIDEIPSYDWGGARTVLSLEAGLLGDSCQGVYFSRLAAERRGRKRARIIHAGSGFDLAAHNADRWLRLQPGTSGALALGIAHVLLADGTFDQAALERAGGLSGFEALVATFDPARTAAITQLAADDIVAVARRMWRAQPAFALTDERSVGFDNGVDTARAALALNVVLGALEAPSGGVRLPVDPPLRRWPTIAGEVSELASPADALDLLTGKSPPRVALLHATNPVFARARPTRWRDALDGIETVVSFSPFLDETTAEVADIVLPDHTYLERREDAGAAPALPQAVVAVRQPAVAPLHDTRSSGDVVLTIARRLGGQLAAALPWARFSDAVDARLLGLHDARRGSVRAPSEHAFLSRLYDAGVWSEAAPPPPRAIGPQLPAAWTEPGWRGDPAAFPLRLVVYRPLGTTSGGGGANLPWLQQLKGRPGDRAWQRAARLHPSSAAGIADGDRVEITSEHGSIEMPVIFDHRLEPDVLSVPLGGGHTAFGRFARGRGANPMKLLATDSLCATRVKIARSS